MRNHKPSPLDYGNGRRTITFKDEEDVKNKATDLQSIIEEWLLFVDE